MKPLRRRSEHTLWQGRISVVAAVVLAVGASSMGRAEGFDTPAPTLRMEQAADGTWRFVDLEDRPVGWVAESGESELIVWPAPPQLPGWPLVIGEVDSTPAVADIDSDGDLEVVVPSHDGKIYVVHANASDVDGWPLVVAARYVSFSAASTVADIDQDGTSEIFVGARYQLLGLHPNGQPLPGWPVESRTGFGSATLEDLDADGQVEIISSEEGYTHVLGADGRDRPGWPFAYPLQYYGAVGAAVGDVTGDGATDLVFPVYSHPSLYAFTPGGLLLPGFPLTYEFGVGSGLSLVDVDGDGTQEIWFHESQNVWLLDGDGTPLPGWPVRSNTIGNAAPAIGELDGDPGLEMVWASPGGNGQVFLYNDDGTLSPGWPITVPSFSFNAQATLGDVDGDGGVDIVLGGFTTSFGGFSGRIYAWHADGTLVPGFPFALPDGKTVLRSSVTITDLDQDGEVDLLVGTITGIGGTGSGRVFAFDLGVPYNPNTMEWPTLGHDLRQTNRWEPLPCPDHDVDLDGVCGPLDNCPRTRNADQADRDRDGAGDGCDTCPNLPNPAQEESVACIATSDDGGECLEATIELLQPERSGEVQVLGRLPAVPARLALEVLGASCEAVDPIRLRVNGIEVATLDLDPALTCYCEGLSPANIAANPAALAGAWHPEGNNLVEVELSGFHTVVAWMRLELAAPGTLESGCLFDAEGGACDVASFCEAGFIAEPFVVSEMRASPVLADTLVVAGAYEGLELPGLLRLEGVPDGPAVLCVTAAGTPAPVPDCAAVTKQGEAYLAVNGAPCGPPTAVAGADSLAECTSPAGAVVVLDGSASTDPNSTPRTHDDIASFEWFEDFGLTTEVLLGVGETLSVTLPLGSHRVTLRVRDRFGQQAVDALDVAVVDTTPPALTVVAAPETLWPPDHRMVPVTAIVHAADLCGAVSVTLVSVTSDESDDAIGPWDGRTTADIRGAELGTPDLAFSLRAERSERGDGRMYLATYRAQDASGNPAEASAAVEVPLHRRR